MARKIPKNKLDQMKFDVRETFRITGEKQPIYRNHWALLKEAGELKDIQEAPYPPTATFVGAPVYRLDVDSPKTRPRKPLEVRKISVRAAKNDTATGDLWR